MFVPSLSWQNDGIFLFKMASQKLRFLTAVTSCGQRSSDQKTIRRSMAGTIVVTSYQKTNALSFVSAFPMFVPSLSW